MIVGDADVALEAAHQPMQAVEVLIHAERGQQRLRAGIVVGIVERLHRRLQQHLVSRRRARSSPGVRRRRRRARTRRSPAPGSFCIACWVTLALMPSPPITIAIRGPSLRPCERLHGAGIDFGRTRAVGRDARDGAVARRLEQALLERRADVARAAGIGDLLALAGRAVDDGDGLGVGRGRRRPAALVRRRTPGPAPALAPVRRAVIAARALRRGAARHDRRHGRAWFRRIEAGRDHRDRARRRADRRPPAPRPRRRSTNSPSTPAMTCGTRIGSLKRRPLLSWRSGRAGRSVHRPPRPDVLANHAEARVEAGSLTLRLP